MSDVGTRIFPMRMRATSVSTQLDVKSAAESRQEARGKRFNPLAQCPEPHAYDEAVIQFTGGTL
jgi:hypothetical protein